MQEVEARKELRRQQQCIPTVVPRAEIFKGPSGSKSAAQSQFPVTLGLSAALRSLIIQVVFQAGKYLHV